MKIEGKKGTKMDIKKRKFLVFLIYVIISSWFFIYTESNTENITLEVWTPDLTVLCRDCGKHIMYEAIQEYQADRPHVKINHQTKGDWRENQSNIEAAFIDDKLPDVFVFNLGSHAEPFLEKEKILTLNSLLSNHAKNKILKSAYWNVSKADKIYALPFTGHVAFILCNSEIFEAHNIQYPNTYDELIEVCQQFKAKGIIPFAHAISESEKWSNIFFYETLVMRHGGYHTVIEHGIKKLNFKDSSFLKAAKDIEKLIKADAFAKNAVSLGYSKGIELFASEKAAMCYSGNWILEDIGESNSLIKQGKIKVIRFPSVKNGKGTAKETWGGASLGLMVHAQTNNKEQAVEFAEYLCEYLAKNYSLNRYIEYTQIALWDVENKIKPKYDIVNQINGLVKDTAYLIAGWDMFIGEQNTEIYWNSLYKLFLGEITPEEFYNSLPGNSP
ncbi:MAG: extracellular solute-binding protein [Spirochaetales bacterium]|nr:extracellular solute-binding protein [Spirochaetales bacterium]